MRAIEAREEEKRRVALKAAAEELEGVKGELAETSRLQRIAEKDLSDLKQKAEREGADLKEEVRQQKAALASASAAAEDAQRQAAAKLEAADTQMRALKEDASQKVCVWLDPPARSLGRRGR